MVKISIISPSIRGYKGIELVDYALQRQDIKEEIEWLIGSPEKIETEYPSIWVKDDFEGGFWTLGRIYNRLIRESKGELLISWQDFTLAKYDCLSRFWFHYQNEPNTIVTAVGNKYTEVLPELGAMVWADPREKPTNHNTYYEVNYNDIEGNLSSFPRQALYDVGGFDEVLDQKGYGLDWYSVLERILLIGGYKFKIDQSIKSYSLVHERYKDWDEHNFVNKDLTFADIYLKHSEKYKENPNLGYLKGGG